MIDPRTWKHEHQIALFCAIGLGAVGGLIVGLHEVSTRMPSWWVYFIKESWAIGWGYYYDESPAINVDVRYWLYVGGWISFGGAVGGVIVYVRQLLRA
jgi:hypothetical protein